jgi:hypothetical protein
MGSLVRIRVNEDVLVGILFSMLEACFLAIGFWWSHCKRPVFSILDAGNLIAKVSVLSLGCWC